MRVLLLTGKGGVGKTTTAAATAVHAARLGTKTLVLSTDGAHSLADALDTRLGAEPTEVEPGLFGQQVDARDRAERSWGGVRDYLLQVLEVIGTDPLLGEDLTLLPGAEEVLALLEVRDQVRHGPWDLVVVDCAPTAETLRLLALPEVLTRCLDRLLPADRRILRALRPLTARHTARDTARAGGLPLPADPVVEAAQRLTRELAEVRQVLTAPGTSARVVLTPEQVVVAEARRTVTALTLHGYAVDAIVANRVVPPGKDPWRSAWAQAQSAVLAAVEADFAPLPVLTAGYAAAEPVGADALAALARTLYGGDETDPDAVTHDVLDVRQVPAPVAVEREGEGFVLHVRLPFTERRDVDLSRRGDELVVQAGAARRTLSLPSALRRCTVEGARLREGALSIRFEPDPDLWRPL